jgi:hypothetical protein
LEAELHVDSKLEMSSMQCGRVINPWVRLTNIDFIYDSIHSLFIPEPHLSDSLLRRHSDLQSGTSSEHPSTS